MQIYVKTQQKLATSPIERCQQAVAQSQCPLMEYLNRLLYVFDLAPKGLFVTSKFYMGTSLRGAFSGKGTY